MPNISRTSPPAETHGQATKNIQTCRISGFKHPENQAIWEEMQDDGGQRTVSGSSQAEEKEEGVAPVKYIYEQFVGGPETCVRFDLDHQANVFLMDSGNYAAFRQGRSFRYHGGWAERSPAELSPPCQGTWYAVVVPKPGTRVRAGIQVYRAA